MASSAESDRPLTTVGTLRRLAAGRIGKMTGAELLYGVVALTYHVTPTSPAARRLVVRLLLHPPEHWWLYAPTCSARAI